MQIIRFTLEYIRYCCLCLWYTLRYRHQLQKIVINGAPKSGTTWMRNILESIPNYHYVGNFQTNLEKFNATKPGDVIHSHHPFTPEFADAITRNNIRVIYILRDPRDRCVSHLFHMLRTGNPNGISISITGENTYQELKTLSHHDQLLACMGGKPNIVKENWSLEWLVATDAWLNSGFSFCLVRYENMLANPHVELKRVLNFLEIPMPDYFLDALIKQNRFERRAVRHHFWQKTRKPGEEKTTEKLRKGIQGDWKNYFTKTHVAQFKCFASQQLIKWGYEKDDRWGENQPDR